MTTKGEKELSLAQHKNPGASHISSIKFASIKPIAHPAGALNTVDEQLAQKLREQISNLDDQLSRFKEAIKKAKKDFKT
jgi:hypothetical protein